MTRTMFAKFSDQERRQLICIFAAGFLMRLALAFRPVSAIATAPFIEDAFYVFQVAWQLSLGKGISIDGVHLTNGIQPLIAFLYTPLFWLGGGKVMGLRLSFVLIGIIDVLSAYFVARVVRDAERGILVDQDRKVSAPVIAAAVWLFAYTFIVQTVNGLETGLYSLLILLSLLQYSKLRSRPNTRQTLVFGLLLGFMVLSRIDAAIFTVVYAVHYLWLGERGAIKRAATFSFLAFVISLPWWIYNHLFFGSIVPISGQAESLAGDLTENIIRAFFTLSDLLIVVTNPPYYRLGPILRLSWIITVPLAALWLVRRFGLVTSMRSHVRLGYFAPLAIFSVGLFFCYTFIFRASWFLPRYFQPLRILLLIFFAAAVPILFSKIGSKVGRKIFNIVAALVIVYSAAQYFRSGFLRPTSDYYEISEWFKHHEPGRVGMFQSGTTSFFADSVTNLDGKVNLAALDALRADTLDRYVEQQKFAYIADWEVLINPLLSQLNEPIPQYEYLDSVQAFRIYRRVSTPSRVTERP